MSRTRPRQLLLSAAALLTLAAALLAYALYHHGSFPFPSPVPSPVPSPSPSPPSSSATRPVLLFFADPSGRGLVAQRAEILGSVGLPPDAAQEATATIARLIAGPTAEPAPLTAVPAQTPIATLPLETVVRALFFDGRGTVVIDLGGIAARLPEGLDYEMLAVWSVVNTLAFNFPADARRVRILVEGQEVETLRGHVLISDALSPRRDLVQGELPSLAAPLVPGGDSDEDPPTE